MCVCVCVCVYIRIWILFNHKNEVVLPFATTWMDLKGIMLNKSERERRILCDLFWKKNKQVKPIEKEVLVVVTSRGRGSRRKGSPGTPCSP